MCTAANQDCFPKNPLLKGQWTFPPDFSALELSQSPCVHVMLAEYDYKKKEKKIGLSGRGPPRCWCLYLDGVTKGTTWGELFCGKAVSFPAVRRMPLALFLRVCAPSAGYSKKCPDGHLQQWQMCSLISSFSHPSSHPFFHPSIHPSIHSSRLPSIYSPVHPSIHLSIFPSILPATHSSFHPFIHPRIPSSIPPSSRHPLCIQHLARHCGNTEIHRTSKGCLLPSEDTHQRDRAADRAVSDMT